MGAITRGYKQVYVHFSVNNEHTDHQCDADAIDVFVVEYGDDGWLVEDGPVYEFTFETVGVGEVTDELVAKANLLAHFKGVEYNCEVEWY